MSESEQDVEDPDQLVICPYDSSHKVTAARMGHHLKKCRGNFPISEKAICPFNDKHGIFAPEMGYHRSVCPQKPVESETQQDVSDTIDTDGGNPKDKLFESFSSGTSSNFSSGEANATGCESGLDVGGGIRNFIGEANELDAIVCNEPNGENQHSQNRLGQDYRDMEENGLVLPNHNESIERQLEQSESDITCKTNSSTESDESFCEEERFDYTKYIPSKDLKEDFLKLIGQPRNGQVYEAKCESGGQSFAIQQWPQGYNALPALFQSNNGFQSTGMQPTFVSFNMMPPIASCQLPYTSSYAFQNQTPGPGFLQAPSQGYDYIGYPAARPSYYRSYYRRRNNYSSSRYSNHKSYNAQNHENHADTFFNGLNQSEISLGESGCYLNKLNGTKIHDEISTSHSLCINNGCDKEQPLLPPHLSKNSFYFKKNKVDDVDGQEQLDGFGQAPNKLITGDPSAEGVSNHHGSQQDLQRKEIEKQIRKIKKKLAEINGLEEKYHKGASLDCDQLKKMSRKSEFEDQLQSLNLP